MSQQQKERENCITIACMHCTEEKKRCSGDSTCDRCAGRGLTCSYPITVKKRGSKLKYIIDDDHERQGSSIELLQPLEPASGDRIRKGDIVQVEPQLLLNDATLNSNIIANFNHNLDDYSADPLKDNFFPPLSSIQPTTYDTINSMNTHDTTLHKGYHIFSNFPYTNNYNHIPQNNETTTFHANPLEILDFELWDDPSINDQ
ncbi:5109_t:CDS:2 [Acaulospora morrowiae]|uniref:5109_t:CDS:1 n=1 Tax=Acaulospora morrowiae TaxID=94023 RepID=A0A9N8VYT6_9GLOM|nr:5109_t:CDS:2 [Acaulospora morrowiae]